jgi:glycosyltransferase involved in cell wall biosynthesis
VKSVLIYNASWHTYGGGEKYVCTLADALSETGTYDVTLLIDKPSITKEALSRYFNLGLSRITIKTTTSRQVPSLLSEADIGVVVSNFRSFGNRAKKNVTILQIPYSKITGLRIACRIVRGDFKEAGKDILRRSLLSTARNADLVLVYSEFVRDVLHRSHNINSQILYPAIDDFSESIAKENIILSVGRFFRGLYNDKRYDFQIDAFKRLRQVLPHTSWTYHLVGSCGTDVMSQRYLDELRSAATGHPVYFHVNSSYEELRRCYGQAGVFWHATGFDVDEERHPERTEHFGMSTVEAMSAGCIPVVINKGGQKEIVSHGKSGYLWNTLDELLEHTASLISDHGRRNAMQQHARERSQDFDRQHFSSRLISLFTQLDKV